MLQSSRFKVNYPDPNRSDSADVPRDFGSLVVGLEQAAMYGQGTLASRPNSSVGTPGIQGRFYMATDQSPHVLYYDFGTGWDSVGSLAAGSISSTQLADGAVITIKLADGAVTSAKILDGTIVAGDIADNTLTAAKLVDAIVPSRGASAATEALRALGTAAGRAAPGTHATQHAPSGADPIVPAMGSSFPTSGLFSGYQFILVFGDTVSGSQVQLYTYRPDLDGTFPWHFTGGFYFRHIVTGSVHAVSSLNPIVNCSNIITVPRSGIYQTDAVMATTSNGNGGVARHVAGGLVSGFAGGTSVHGFRAQLSAGATVYCQVSDTFGNVNLSDASTTGILSCMPQRVI